MIDRAEREAMIDSLQVGDLVRLNGTLRIVRGIHKPNPKSTKPHNRVYSVTFSILRCSWTRKPYTVKGRVDMYNVPLEVVQRDYGTMHNPIDVLLQADCENRSGDTLLKCCDVIGVTS